MQDSDQKWNARHDDDILLVAGITTMINASTSPPMDQSRLEPSSPVQVQSKQNLDWDRTDPRC